MNTPKFNQILENIFSTLEEKVWTKTPKMFKPSDSVYYTFEDVRAGTLNEREKRVWDVVEKGKSYSGSELLSLLRNEIDMGTASLMGILNNLLKMGVVEANVEAEPEKELDFEVSDEEELSRFSNDEDEDIYGDDEENFYGESVETLEEAKKSYSAKKARAGKDIGKPGKMFSKIAKSAAKKYGSKEAGKRVAGAILKKLRKK